MPSELHLYMSGVAAALPPYQQHLICVAWQVLCGGTREEKMQPIFNLFHNGERGGITVRDIATYTTSAFRAMFKLQPSLEGEVRAVHFSVASFSCCPLHAVTR